MRSFDPTHIVENGRHGSIVLRTWRCCAPAKHKLVTRVDRDDFTPELSNVCSKISPTLVDVVYLGNVRSIRTDPQRVDNIGADQIRMSEVEPIIQVFEAIRLDRKRIDSVVC